MALAALRSLREAPAAQGRAVEPSLKERGALPAEAPSGIAAITLTSDLLSIPSRAPSEVLGAFSLLQPRFLKAFLVLNSGT